MPLDRTAVAKIADLARIHVPDEQLDALAGELSAILGWVEQLAEVDTDGVEPLRAVMPIKAAWRADTVSDGGRAEAILQNAPEAQDGCFVVPKVVE